MGRLELSRVVIHGHDVRYRRGGDGEAVLLIHGLAGSSHTWKAVQPALLHALRPGPRVALLFVVRPLILEGLINGFRAPEVATGHANTARALLAARRVALGPPLGGAVRLEEASGVPRVVVLLFLRPPHHPVVLRVEGLELARGGGGGRRRGEER